MQVIEAGFTVAAFALLAVLGRGVFVYARPYRKCRWCRPGGLIRGSLLGRIAGHERRTRRRRGCWRCKGTKLTRRLGARHMHRVRLSLQQAWAERGQS